MTLLRALGVKASDRLGPERRTSEAGRRRWIAEYDLRRFRVKALIALWKANNSPGVATLIHAPGVGVQRRQVNSTAWAL